MQVQCLILPPAADVDVAVHIVREEAGVAASVVRAGPHELQFHRAYDAGSQQEEISESCLAELIPAVAAGRSAAVFVVGEASDAETKQPIAQSVATSAALQLFSLIGQAQEAFPDDPVTWAVRVSAFVVSAEDGRETVYDALAAAAGQGMIADASAVAPGIFSPRRGVILSPRPGGMSIASAPPRYAGSGLDYDRVGVSGANGEARLGASDGRDGKAPFLPTSPTVRVAPSAAVLASTASPSAGGLVLRDDPHFGALTVPGLWEIECESEQDVADLLSTVTLGSTPRPSSATSELPARCHSVIQLTVHQSRTVLTSSEETGEDQEVKQDLYSRFNVVRLAKASHTPTAGSTASGSRMPGSARHSPTIPPWVLSLSECLAAVEQRQPRVPWGSSKATMLLRDGITGRIPCVTLAVVPNTIGIGLATLQFAARLQDVASTIQTQRDLAQQAAINSTVNTQVPPTRERAAVSGSARIVASPGGSFSTPSGYSRASRPTASGTGLLSPHARMPISPAPLALSVVPEEPEGSEKRSPRGQASVVGTSRSRSRSPATNKTGLSWEAHVRGSRPEWRDGVTALPSRVSGTPPKAADADASRKMFEAAEAAAAPEATSTDAATIRVVPLGLQVDVPAAPEHDSRPSEADPNSQQSAGLSVSNEIISGLGEARTFTAGELDTRYATTEARLAGASALAILSPSGRPGGPADLSRMSASLAATSRMLFASTLTALESSRAEIASLRRQVSELQTAQQQMLQQQAQETAGHVGNTSALSVAADGAEGPLLSSSLNASAAMTAVVGTPRHGGSAARACTGGAAVTPARDSSINPRAVSRGRTVGRSSGYGHGATAASYASSSLRSRSGSAGRTAVASPAQSQPAVSPAPAQPTAAASDLSALRTELQSLKVRNTALTTQLRDYALYREVVEAALLRLQGDVSRLAQEKETAQKAAKAMQATVAKEQGAARDAKHRVQKLETVVNQLEVQAKGQHDAMRVIGQLRLSLREARAMGAGAEASYVLLRDEVSGELAAYRSRIAELETSLKAEKTRSHSLEEELTHLRSRVRDVLPTQSGSVAASAPQVVPIPAPVPTAVPVPPSRKPSLGVMAAAPLPSVAPPPAPTAKPSFAVMPAGLPSAAVLASAAVPAPLPPRSTASSRRASISSVGNTAAATASHASGRRPSVSNTGSDDINAAVVALADEVQQALGGSGSAASGSAEAALASLQATLNLPTGVSSSALSAAIVRKLRGRR